MQQLELDLDTLTDIADQRYQAVKTIRKLKQLIVELDKKQKVVCKHPQEYIRKSALGLRNPKAVCTLCNANLTERYFHST